MKFLNSLLGFAGGAFVLAAPAYSSEIAETKYRGILGTMMQLMVCVGILFINLNCETDWRGWNNQFRHQSLQMTGVCRNSHNLQSRS